MSPEQARGDLEHLGPLSDVYSMGATLYCLLTGKPPFEGDDVGEVMRKAQRGESPSPRQIDATIDKALEAVCLKAMAVNPEDRYASCQALAEDIERWMADEPVLARPEPFRERAGRYMRRNRTVMSTAAAGLFAGLFGLGAIAAVESRANARLTSTNALLTAANTREQERFQLALEAIQTFHTGISEDMHVKEKQFDKLRKSLLSRAADFYRKLEVMLKDERDQRSRAALSDAYYQLAILTRAIGSKQLARESSRQMLEIARTLAAEPGAGPEAKVRLLYAIWLNGRLQQATDDYLGARKTVEEGVAVGEELLMQKPTRDTRMALSRCYDALASIQIDLSQSGEALATQKRAATILEEIVAANPRDFPAQHALANVYFSRGYVHAYFSHQPGEALQDLELARKIEKDLAAADPDYPEYLRVVAEIDSMLGFQHFSRGQTAAALDVLNEGRQTIEKLVAAYPNIPLFQSILGGILNILSAVFAKQGNLAKAIELQRESGEICAKLAEADPADGQYQRELVRSFNNIGDFELAADRIADAIESYRKARALIEPLVKAQPANDRYQSGLAFALSGLGRAHARIGDISGSAAELRQAMAIWNRASSSSPEERYAEACCHAILAGLAGENGSGIAPSAAELEARKTIDMLKESIITGYRTVKEVRADRDFKAVAGRPDFENLLLDLSFPANPFAEEN
jgi:tetratricopeptide (TPR) repeat protein